MADTFGLVTLPAAATVLDPEGDAALGKLGAFLQATINGYCNVAWTSNDFNGARQPVVDSVYTSDPEKFAFNDADLPGLFIWRVSGTQDQLADDMLMAPSVVRALWVMQGDAREVARTQMPFYTTVARAVQTAISIGRDPLWSDPGDTDPNAASVPASADAIRLSHACPTVQTVYSGAGLDGAVGGAVMGPLRCPTITTTAATGAYSTSLPITLSVVTWHGDAADRTLLLTNANGGETVSLGESVKQVTAITMPGQPSAVGSFSVGTQFRKGRGSSLLGVMNAERVKFMSWAITPLRIDLLDGEQRQLQRGTYYGLDMMIECRDQLVRDPAAHGSLWNTTVGQGIAIDYLNSDGSIATSAALPDHTP